MIAWVLTVWLLCHVSFALDLSMSAEEKSEMMERLRRAAENGEDSMSETDYLDYLRATGRDEEFAKLMGIEDVSLVRPSETARTEEDFMFTTVSPLGDILLTPNKAEQARQGLNIYKYGGNRWPNDTIPYYISTADYSRRERQHIDQAFQEMASKLHNVKICRKLPEHKSYVHVFSGKGCYSHLAHTGGKQPLSLQSNGCLRIGTILHEMDHAIGFAHEHSRPDRDDYIEMKPENIPSDWQSQYEKVDDVDFKLYGPYEHGSAMHYPINAPGTNKPAYRVLDESVDQSRIGQRDGLTDTDYMKIDNMYAK